MNRKTAGMTVMFACFSSAALGPVAGWVGAKFVGDNDFGVLFGLSWILFWMAWSAAACSWADSQPKE